MTQIDECDAFTCKPLADASVEVSAQFTEKLPSQGPTKIFVQVARGWEWRRGVVVFAIGVARARSTSIDRQIGMPGFFCTS